MSARLTDPSHWELQDTLSTAFPLFVLWSLWTGILLLRRRPRTLARRVDLG